MFIAGTVCRVTIFAFETFQFERTMILCIYTFGFGEKRNAMAYITGKPAL